MSAIDKYISIDPSIHAGMPCVSGTRVPVADVVAAFDSGSSPEDIAAMYQGVSRIAVEACLSCRESAPAPGTQDSLLVESDSVARL